MADGGASTFIMLITGLLISSAVSALLITEWTNTAKVAQVQQRGAQLSSELSIEFAGDPMMVDFDNSTSTETITFHALNTGQHPMDETQLSVFVDGRSPTAISVSFVGSATEWNSNVLLEIELQYTCLLYTSPSPRDRSLSRMPSSA